MGEYKNYHHNPTLLSSSTRDARDITFDKIGEVVGKSSSTIRSSSKNNIVSFSGANPSNRSNRGNRGLSGGN